MSHTHTRQWGNGGQRAWGGLGLGGGRGGGWRCRPAALVVRVALAVAPMWAAVALAHAEPSSGGGREISRPIEDVKAAPKEASPKGSAEKPKPAAPAYANVGEVLAALERSGEKIQSLQAKLLYDRTFVLQGDRHIRYGTLYYLVKPGSEEADAAPTRMFSVKFDEIFVDSVKRPDAKLYIFDGEWFVERSEKEKQYIARQIARPGESFDPLRLGEGPMPIPIGQRAADILARYDADLPPLLDGVADEVQYKATAEKFSHVQLRLVPRAERKEEDEFREVRLWYERDKEGVLLPRLARTVSRAGDVSYVQLWKLSRNEPIPESAVTIDPPPEGAGWDVQIDEGRFKK